MDKVSLTYRPTRDPEDAQPGRVEMETVTHALIQLHRLNLGRGFQSGIEIRKDDEPVYDLRDGSLLKAMSRISALISDGTPLEQAAEQVAKEDGHAV